MTEEYILNVNGHNSFSDSPHGYCSIIIPSLPGCEPTIGTLLTLMDGVNLERLLSGAKIFKRHIPLCIIA